MTEVSRDEQFDNLETEYSEVEDQEMIRANRAAYNDASQLASLASSESGRILVKYLKDEISKNIQLIIETRKARYVSDLDSNLSLLTKLIGAKKTTEAIGSWLDSIE
jgi:hypothetical protein